jgi:hypothetical protein
MFYFLFLAIIATGTLFPRASGVALASALAEAIPKGIQETAPCKKFEGMETAVFLLKRNWSHKKHGFSLLLTNLAQTRTKLSLEQILLNFF